ncbi:P1 family peptidase [Tenuibacillus multivorans]|uniref:L-aminopeptidase/D-esterase n=1 Tax=Tenuibacillus multivorans TaxID=237069 RepID=A0A1G9YR28_9BACI|nr:P1 family peptidase [Tenuibacillus multivorans]GEL78840.1 peptidase [Tenuibacillus multivorans]SDN10933.1 L-aminopeptidase/D-esterase [Tenuibacillus multivorans]
MSFDNITDVPGVKVGHQQNTQALTGCSVILTEDGAVASVDVRGAAPGTRETDLLEPVNMVDQVHAISLAGGSAYGLDASSGVMQFLEDQGVGLDVGVAKVPIVPSAILFDLAFGDASVRPDKQMGYEAAQKASSGIFKQGNIGAGCGATVGKIMGFENSMKSGLGSASVTLDNGLVVGAMVAVNALGDVRDPKTGEIIAGPVNPETKDIVDSEQFILDNVESFGRVGQNTTIGAVGVNAKLSKAEAKKVAQMTQNAIGRTIHPAHTMFDGDTIFALATGDKQYSIDLIGSIATQVMEKAIIRAVKEADPIQNLPAYE